MFHFLTDTVPQFLKKTKPSIYLHKAWEFYLTLQLTSLAFASWYIGVTRCPCNEDKAQTPCLLEEAVKGYRRHMGNITTVYLYYKGAEFLRALCEVYRQYVRSKRIDRIMRV